MIAAVVALALAAVAASGAAVVLALRGGAAQVVAAKLAGQLADAHRMHGDAVRELGKEVAARVDDVARLEKVIAELKAENNRLEGVLDESLEPTAVRERARRLLGGPQAATAGPAAAGGELIGVRPAAGAGVPADHGGVRGGRG